MNIDFHKIEDAQLISYQHYLALVNNNDLIELNSYKIRNILSIVFNTRIKDLILENLFNFNSAFLTSETKDSLSRYLSADERSDLKDYLSNYLDFQIKSEWHYNIVQLLNAASIKIIIIPTLIFNNDLILTELKLVFPKAQFVDWFKYDETKKVLILDYNHSWRKQNIFTIQESNFNAYFLKHFFENVYLWKVYKEERHIFNRMNTHTRESLFGKEVLTQVKEKLILLRPQNTLNEWDVLHENNHKISFIPQEEIVIYFNATNSNKYRINASFLLEKDGKYILKNGKDLLSNPSEFEGKYKFSNLENIISQVDLSELNKAIEKDKSINEIIQPLWTKFNLNKNDGRLWKQLLQRKAIEHGINEIFSAIERISGIKQFISLNTFENAYCNPKNNTIIPREKKVFKAICKYLELPEEYRAAIHRERNLIGGHSQERNSKLYELGKSILDLGILDKIKNDDELLEILNQTKEEIGKRIDMEYFGFTKDSLIYVCIAICYEIINKMKLKLIIKIEHIIPS
jgi:hypothetical protein